MAHLNPAVGKECPFCGTEETVDHLFLDCMRLDSICIILKNCFEGLSEDFSNQHLLVVLNIQFKGEEKYAY